MAGPLFLSMTRASLLHVLDPGTALGPQQVRELEALAQAFPYCQTAHLLLAKAAHDQGAMLAGQRLRRAATYAADRALLRRLIETPPPLPVRAAPAATATMPTAVVVPALTPPEPTPAKPGRFVAQRLVGGPDLLPVAGVPLEPSITEPVTTVAGFEAAEAAETPLPPPMPVLIPGEAVAPAAPVPTAAPAPAIGRAGVAAATGWSVSTTAAPDSGEATGSLPPKGRILTVEQPLHSGVKAVETASLAPVSATEAVPAAAEPAAVSAAVLPPAPSVAAADGPAFAPAPVTAAEVAETEMLVGISTEPEPVTEHLPESVAAATAPASAAAQAITSLISDPESPTPAVFEPLANAPAPVAPPVRPPADAGAARFEYGLADALDPTPAYLLPGLTDEWTWTLPPKPFVPPGLTPAAFLGDQNLGYGWGESSRLGLALLPLAVEGQSDEVLPTAFALPLPEAFFAPDALLLAHWAAHRPQALPPPTSLELIETFLRQKPRLTRPAFAKTTTETPTDLAAPSTNAPPELVSESLARILARQGKLARAIEVYERLMVKHPEKMAYFATEIQSLQLQQPPLP